MSTGRPPRPRIVNPWLLTPTNTQKTIGLVRDFIQSHYPFPVTNNYDVNGGGGNGGQNGFHTVAPAQDVDWGMIAESVGLDVAAGFGGGPLEPTWAPAAMAPAYVRLWLAVKEIPIREPFALIAKAAATAIREIELQVAEERATELRVAAFAAVAAAADLQGGGMSHLRTGSNSSIRSSEREPAREGQGMLFPSLTRGADNTSTAADLGQKGQSSPYAAAAGASPWGSPYPPSNGVTAGFGSFLRSSGSNLALPSFGAGGSASNNHLNGFASHSATLDSSGAALEVEGGDDYDPDLFKSHLYEWNRCSGKEATLNRSIYTNCIFCKTSYYISSR